MTLVLAVIACTYCAFRAARILTDGRTPGRGSIVELHMGRQEAAKLTTQADTAAPNALASNEGA